MKKPFLLICLLVLSIAPILQAQYFTGGFKLGITGSQIDGDQLGGYNKPGVSAGIFVNRKINYHFNWQSELYYIMKGVARPTTTANPETYRMTLHYVEMPFLGIYRISDKIESQAGVSLGYLWHASRNIGMGSEEVNYKINKIDFSVLFGVTYNVNEKLQVNLKWSHSILPNSHEPGNLTWFGTYGQYNHLLDLSVYYTIK